MAGLAVCARLSVVAGWAGRSILRMATAAATALAFHADKGFVTVKALFSRSGNTWVGFAENLSASDFTPDVSGAEFAKVHIVLHHRSSVL
jgi:hypothetical protein